MKPPETIEFGPDHQKRTMAIIGNNLALVSKMNNGNMIFSQASCRNKISTQLGYIQSLRQSLPKSYLQNTLH